MSRDDNIHDILDVQVGKLYRGSMVQKIDIETTNLEGGKVKVRRTIHMYGRITVIEESMHEHGEVFENGKVLPHDKIPFPSCKESSATFEEDEEEKIKKRELLRQKAREMMKNRRQ